MIHVQHAIKMLAFVVSCVIMLHLLSAVFVDKSITSSVKYEAIPPAFNTFYEERGDSLDVVFLGSSHIFSGISPMEMWDTYGICGYDCTSSSQDAIKSYYFLEEIFKYQSPKVVVFDLMSLFIGKTNDEISNRSAFNNLRFSPTFVKMARDSINRENNESLLSLIFPVLRYHSRWAELGKVDFQSKAMCDSAKGYDMRYGTTQAVPLTQENFPLLMGAEQTNEIQPVVEESADYICRIVDMCSENGAKILFIKTPTSGYTYEMGNAMQKFAGECGIPLIDYNLKWQELGLDYSADFLDTVHLNLNGARKLSASLGKTLVDSYGIGGHKGEDGYSDWGQDMLKYEARIEALEIPKCIDVSAWMEKARNSRYVILYSGDATQIDSGMKDWLHIASLDETGICYGVLDNHANEAISYVGMGKILYRIGDIACEVNSLDSYKIRLLSEDVIKREVGFCLIVFDRELQRVVDSVVILNGQISR